MDGLTALRAIRAAGVTTPIILLTGQGDERLAVEMMRAGANDYLSKTRLSRDLLSHSVRHAVRLHRAQAEASLARGLTAETEQRFRTMADSAPVLLWVADEQGAGVYFNQGWLDYTGRTLEQELGDGWAEGVHPDDRRRGAARLARRRSSGASGSRRSSACGRRDGTYGWVLETRRAAVPAGRHVRRVRRVVRRHHRHASAPSRSAPSCSTASRPPAPPPSWPGPRRRRASSTTASSPSRSPRSCGRPWPTGGSITSTAAGSTTPA